MKTTTIYFDNVTYAIPCDAVGNPVSQFTLPDGSLVSVGRWAETVPYQPIVYKRDALGAPVAMPVAETRDMVLALIERLGAERVNHPDGRGITEGDLVPRDAKAAIEALEKLL